MLSIFLFFSVFYSVQLLFFIQISKYWNKSVLYKTLIFILIYLFQNTFIIFVLHFSYGRNFIFLLLEKMQKNTILKDPQDFLYVLFNTGGILLNSILFCIILFLIHFFCSNVLRHFEYRIYILVLFIFIHLFITGSWIFFTDIITTHWEIFYQDKTFDFQPDLIRWFLHYKGEFFDLMLYLILIGLMFIFLIIVFSLVIKIDFITKTSYPILFRLFMTFFLAVFSMSFFGGETFLRDMLLLVTSFFFSEIIFFSLLFFRVIKRFR